MADLDIETERGFLEPVLKDLNEVRVNGDSAVPRVRSLDLARDMCAM